MSGFHIVWDDSDYGIGLYNKCSPLESIEDCEKHIQEYGRTGVIYHICEVKKTVRFKFSPELEEIKND